MNRLLCFFLLIPAILSCATVTEKLRLSKFDKTHEAYETTMKGSHYGAALGYIDPSLRNEKLDFDALDNVKIVDYKTTYIKVSEDRFKIEQEVSLQYFLLDRNIVKTIQYREVWLFNEVQGKWWLHTPLPSFGN